MALLGELTRGKHSGCLIIELASLDCRLGCVHCSLSEKLALLKEIFPSKEEGPGGLFYTVDHSYTDASNFHKHTNQENSSLRGTKCPICEGNSSMW